MDLNRAEVMALDAEAKTRARKYARSTSSLSSASQDKNNSCSHSFGQGSWHHHAGSLVLRRPSVYLLLLIAALMAIIFVRATSPRIRLRRSTPLRASHTMHLVPNTAEELGR